MALAKGTTRKLSSVGGAVLGPRETRVEGLSQVLSNLRDYRYTTVPKAVEKGQIKAAKMLLKASQKVVPVGDGTRQAAGTLKRSGFVSVSGKGLDTVCTVGYTAPYAIYVHENLSARHKAGKIAKYLEKPARDMKSQLRDVVREECRKAMR